MADTVQPGSRIRWRYRLFLADGYEVERNTDPAGDILSLGQGQVHPALEQVLHGMHSGEHTNFLLTADAAFGFPDPSAIQVLARNLFPDSLALAHGQIISFALPSGQEIPGKVLELDEETVRVDFNHPLAGHNLRFEVEIVAILD